MCLAFGVGFGLCAGAAVFAGVEVATWESMCEQPAATTNNKTHAMMQNKPRSLISECMGVSIQKGEMKVNAFLSEPPAVAGGPIDCGMGGMCKILSINL